MYLKKIVDSYNFFLFWTSYNNDDVLIKLDKGTVIGKNEKYDYLNL